MPGVKLPAIKRCYWCGMTTDVIQHAMGKHGDLQSRYFWLFQSTSLVARVCEANGIHIGERNMNGDVDMWAAH
jgi:hypothetical protein